MKLNAVIGHYNAEVYGNRDVEVTGITHDSRDVTRGFVFVALAGAHHDGKDFITQALDQGARVIVSDTYAQLGGATVVVVQDVYAALGHFSANFYAHPDKKLSLVGVTGTNGKTTITYFLEHLLRRAHQKPGIIGTINYRYGKKVFPSVNTTPIASDIFRILHEMKRNKCGTIVMEVSSHALALGRVEQLEFDIGIFTNLTRDHLDFHKNMQSYFSAKKKLFTSLEKGTKNNAKCAIINIDDPWGKKLAQVVPGVAISTYGVSKSAAVRAKRIQTTHRGTRFMLMTGTVTHRVHIHHVGLHNVYNALAAVAAALSMGISLKTVLKELPRLPMVPGRLEKIDCGQEYTVVVDYAHTDDALKNVLLTLKKLKPKRLITVFGCGGDRDRTKRPLMGELATALSDFVFVTSDNPRSEEPQRIALDIEVGIRRQNRNNYQVILDREQAIATAVHMARRGDIVLIAGKGHETYQIVGDQKYHFNDSEVAKKYING